MNAPSAPQPSPSTKSEIPEHQESDFDISGLPPTSLDGAVESALAAKESLKVSTTPPGDPDKPADFRSFEPVERDESGNPITPPEPKPAPQGGVEPDKKKKGDNNAIREQILRVNEEKKAIQASLETEKTEKTKLQKELDELKAKLAEGEKSRSELLNRLSEKDPSQSKAVREKTEPWNQAVREMSVVLAEHGIEAKGLDQFMVQMSQAYAAAGDPSTEEFRSKVVQIRRKIGETFGPELAERGMELVRSGATTLRSVQAIIADMRANAPKYERQEAMGRYMNERQALEEDLRGTFEASEELKESDPLNTKVILSTMVAGSEPIKQQAEKAKKLAEFVFLPLPPPSDDLLAGKSPEEQKSVLLARAERHRAAFRKARAVFPEALVALQVLPQLWQQYITFKKQVGLSRQTPRPKVDGDAPLSPDDTVQPASIREFNPAPPAF